MTLKVLLVFSLTCSILIDAAGQQPQPTPTAQKSPASRPGTPADVDDQDVVKITTNLVQIDVVVTKDGKPVTDLQPQDFEIFEDGKLQTITNFSFVSNVAPGGAPPPVAKNTSAGPVLPAKIDPAAQRRIVAIVVDDLGISYETMSTVRNQVKKFLDTLSPNDLVAIIRTGGDVGALQQFTNDRRVLQTAVERLRWNPCSRAGFYVFRPAGSQSANTGLCSQFVMNTTLKSLRFILRGMSLLPGRKSLVFMSDYLPIQDQQPSAYEETKQAALGESAGNDSQSNQENDATVPDTGLSYHAQLQRIAELAIRSSVVIYSVDTRGLQYTGPTAIDRVVAGSPAAINSQINSILRSRSSQLLMGREGSDLIAKQTGGFLVRNSNDFGLKQIMQDQQGYYLIGFRPSEETFNRNFHHIKAKVKRGGYTVRTRAGFYGFTDEETRPKEYSVDDVMTRALISPFGAKDINLNLTSFFLDDPVQGPIVRSFLYLDQRDLTFTETEGWQTTNLDIRSVMFGDNGRVLLNEGRTGRLRLRGDAYQRAVRDGITYTFDIPVKARGAFQFRVAVRDVNTGRVGSAGQFVELPNLASGRLALSGVVATQEAPAPQASLTNDDVTTGPAVRRFRQGSVAVFAYAIYNAGVTGQPPQLTSQMRVFRDGKIVFNGEPRPVELAGQTDTKRLLNALRLQLGSDMPPGEYAFQVIVTDMADKRKPRVASQWIDFEVVK